MVVRVLATALLSVLFLPFLVAVRGAIFIPFDIHFEIPSPVASSINPTGKIPRTVTGQSFCAVARGGTATDLVVTLRECVGAGAITCGSVLTADITINAVDTEVCGTISDTVWTAGGYLEMDVVSSTSSPTVVFGHANGGG